MGKEGGGYQGAVDGQSAKQVELQKEGGVGVEFWQFALQRSEMAVGRSESKLIASVYGQMLATLPSCCDGKE